MRIGPYIFAGVLIACFGLLLVRPVHPQTTVGMGAIGDPCQDARIPKVVKAVTISTATTTAVTAVSGNTQTYVCGFTLVNGISQVITFEQGAGVACASSVVALTGAMTTAGAINVLQSGSGNGTIFTAGPATGLCIVSGAAVAANGWVTYVQQ